MLRVWERDKIELALQHKAAIVIDVPDDSSVRGLKEGEKYPAGRRALPDLGRLRKLTRELAERQGVPMPGCGREMLELQGRQVSCPKCGLAARRDDIPIVWAVRRFDELPQTARSQRRGPSPRPASGASGPRSAEGS
jgi:putative transposase